MENPFDLIATTAEEREMMALYGEQYLSQTQAAQPQTSEAAMAASEGLRYLKAARLMTMGGYVELVDRLKAMNHAYYQKGEPMVTDAEFDCLMLQAEAVEQLHPEWTLADSPTHTVGNDSVTGLPKVIHRTPMLSLSKCGGESNPLKRENLTKWFRRVAEGLDVVAEYKYDGNSVSLVYVDGQLIEASTRGSDGREGSLITAQVSPLASVPTSINATGRIEVRGELYIPNSRFAALPAYEQARTQQAHIRKVLQQTHRPLLASEQGFEVRVWEVIANGESLHSRRMAWAAEQGFTVAPMRRVRTLDEISQAIADMTAERDTIDQPTDGIVLKLDEDEDRYVSGETSAHPKWAIAWKYPTVLMTVTVAAVAATPSGKPLLQFQPVTMNGQEFRQVDVKAAALQQFPFRAGDRIVVSLKPGSGSIQFERIVTDEGETAEAETATSTTTTADNEQLARIRRQREPEGWENWRERYAERKAKQERRDRRNRWLKPLATMAAASVALFVIWNTGLLIPLGLIGLATSGIIK